MAVAAAVATAAGGYTLLTLIEGRSRAKVDERRRRDRMRRMGDDVG